MLNPTDNFASPATNLHSVRRRTCGTGERQSISRAVERRKQKQKPGLRECSIQFGRSSTKAPEGMQCNANPSIPASTIYGYSQTQRPAIRNTDADDTTQHGTAAGRSLDDAIRYMYEAQTHVHTWKEEAEEGREGGALEPHRKHQPIPDRDDNHKCDQTRRYTAREEVLDVEVALARALVFHHDRRCTLLAPSYTNPPNTRSREKRWKTYSY
jgi:hypothetical protein